MPWILILFAVAFVQSLVATLEILCIAHLKPVSTMIFGTVNSAGRFLVMYFIVVTPNRLELIIPYVLGDVLATLTAVVVYRRKNASTSG